MTEDGNDNRQEKRVGETGEDEENDGSELGVKSGWLSVRYKLDLPPITDAGDSV